MTMVISNLLDKIRLLFVTEKKPFLRLKSILGFYPHNIRLYQQALIHKSVAYYEYEKAKAEHKSTANSSSQKLPVFNRTNNERLEYLGDAILGAVVADILYKHYRHKQEGFLTNLRSKIVCRSSLNKLAIDIGLDKLIQHTGAVTTGHNSFMNGNAFEASVGAIYLDRGYRYCYRFMEEQIFAHYIDIDSVAQEEKNFKSALIEWCQKRQYKVEFHQKESRDQKQRNTPMFHSSVLIAGIPCGTGDGYSKKESDQNASCQALKRVKSDKTLLAGIRQATQRIQQEDQTDTDLTTSAESE